MAHNRRFRNGWINEHLACSVLSKFSFVSQPSTIGDDIGVDFFCVSFEIKDKDYCYPQNPFAIQIKSSADKFEITNKIQNINNLAMPFFVGVVNRNKKYLEIFSGEVLTHMFAGYGANIKDYKYFISDNEIKINKVYIQLNRKINGLYENNKDNKWTIKDDIMNINFYKIVEIPYDVEINSEDYKERILLINNNIMHLQKNILLQKNDKYIYKYYSCNDDCVIYQRYAGLGSVLSFRKNLLYSLAESINNCEYLFKMLKFNEADFALSENEYDMFINIIGIIINYYDNNKSIKNYQSELFILKQYYNELKIMIEEYKHTKNQEL